MTTNGALALVSGSIKCACKCESLGDFDSRVDSPGCGLHGGGADDRPGAGDRPGAHRRRWLSHAGGPRPTKLSSTQGPAGASHRDGLGRPRPARVWCHVAGPGSALAWAQAADSLSQPTQKGGDPAALLGSAPQAAVRVTSLEIVQK